MITLAKNASGHGHDFAQQRPARSCDLGVPAQQLRTVNVLRLTEGTAPPVLREIYERTKRVFEIAGQCHSRSGLVNYMNLAPDAVHAFLLPLGVTAVVALDADVKNSTFAEMFAKDSDLADRFVECKIAEQNMVSMAAGMAASGKIPFVSTFSKFLTRAYDQVEMAIYSGANVKFVGSHSGVTLAADGPSQMSLPDVAWFRSFATAKNHQGNPACYVLQPADAYAAYALTQAMAEYDGACYMRTVRPEAVATSSYPSLERRGDGGFWLVESRGSRGLSEEGVAPMEMDGSLVLVGWTVSTNKINGRDPRAG